MKELVFQAIFYSLGIFIYQMLFKGESFYDSFERAVFVGVLTSVLLRLVLN